ncbi:MAG: hypothetical protein WCV58_02180 [Patescibacteria group bacterium]
MEREFTYKISPGLYEILLKSCSVFQEILKKAREAIANDNSISDLAEKFHLSTDIYVSNYTEDKRPIFVLSGLFHVCFDTTEWLTNKASEQKRYNHAEHLVQKIISEAETVSAIDYQGRVAVTRHVENADKYYCLPDEAKAIKNKMLENLASSKEYE